jgi:hypothetical protein
MDYDSLVGGVIIPTIRALVGAPPLYANIVVIPEVVVRRLDDEEKSLRSYLRDAYEALAFQRGGGRDSYRSRFGDSEGTASAYTSSYNGSRLAARERGVFVDRLHVEQSKLMLANITAAKSLLEQLHTLAVFRPRDQETAQPSVDMTMSPLSSLQFLLDGERCTGGVFFQELGRQRDAAVLRWSPPPTSAAVVGDGSSSIPQSGRDPTRPAQELLTFSVSSGVSSGGSGVDHRGRSSAAAFDCAREVIACAAAFQSAVDEQEEEAEKYRLLRLDEVAQPPSGGSGTAAHKTAKPRRRHTVVVASSDAMVRRFGAHFDIAVVPLPSLLDGEIGSGVRQVEEHVSARREKRQREQWTDDFIEDTTGDRREGIVLSETLSPPAASHSRRFAAPPPPAGISPTTV